MQHLKLHASSRNELPPKDGWALPQRFRDRDTVQWIFWYWMTGFLCFRESIPLNMLFYFVSCMNRRCIWFIINNKKCLNFVHLPQRHSAPCWNNLHEYCVISWSTYTHMMCVYVHTHALKKQSWKIKYTLFPFEGSTSAEHDILHCVPFI